MVGIYAAQLASGSGVNANTGWIFEKGVLIAAAIDSDGNVIGVAHGDWWRLLTAAFLHYGPIHLGMNMLALWWFGQPLEAALGRGRFIGLFVASGLAGSAGALLFKPLAPTVGASGAIFGILGAAIVLERQRTYVFGGSAMTMLVLNLAFTFAVPNISIGGHLGGLAGGMLAMLALSRLGRGHAVYGNPDLLGYASLAAIGVASVLVAYFKVRGYA
jgi:membrane associated rhomboid family serine protease